MPLNILGFAYREIKQGLTDTEEMFNAAGRASTKWRMRPAPTPLAAGPGELGFEDVRFGYRPDRAILKGVSLPRAAGPDAGDRRADGRGEVHHLAACCSASTT